MASFLRLRPRTPNSWSRRFTGSRKRQLRGCDVPEARSRASLRSETGSFQPSGNGLASVSFVKCWKQLGYDATSLTNLPAPGETHDSFVQGHHERFLPAEFMTCD